MGKKGPRLEVMGGEDMEEGQQEDEGKEGNNNLEGECRACEESESLETESDVYEDCEDYEEVTDFGCEYYRESTLCTIEEEEEEDEEEEEEDEEEEETTVEMDSDTEKSELEQFEILEQLCSSSSDDFDAEEFCKATKKPERIRSFREYLQYKEVLGADRGEYVNQLMLEADGGKVKVKPVKEERPRGILKDGARRKRDERMPPAIDPPAAHEQVSIFRGAAYDFSADPWFGSRLFQFGDGMKNKGWKGSGAAGAVDEPPRSALKRPGKKRKKGKVQFDESLNKFFEADYVILIREDECECECGGEFCFSAGLDEDDDSYADVDEDELQIPPFDPPIEFVDQLTLSPPDGYKDGCIHSFQDFPSPPGEETLTGEVEKPPCEDNTTQTTPTYLEPPSPVSQPPLDESPPAPTVEENVVGGKPGDRYIVETITMTTVTERRIVRETLDHPPANTMPSRDELTLTLRLNPSPNSLKPNSAVRQLFPEMDKKSPDSDEEDPLQNSLIKRTIERNTLRRSLVKYPADIRLRRKKKETKLEESLEEKIKKLTCDIDEPEVQERTSPPGEEDTPPYRRLTELLRKESHPVVLQQYPYYQGPDVTQRPAEARRQFLSSLAACVAPNHDNTPGSRDSVASSSAATDYSIGDIDDVLTGEPKPDVVAGTPGSEAQDELALFVQQDASRIERIRKRYSSGCSEEDSDDYGFTRRPSVRGIKPRFGSTTEILQRMQSQVCGAHVPWPYYPDLNGYPNGYPPRAYIPRPPIHQDLTAVRATQTSPYYPRYRPAGVGCVGSPTKTKLEGRVGPEGASAPQPLHDVHPPLHDVHPPLHDVHTPLHDVHPPLHDVHPPPLDSNLMYAMNV